AEPTDDSSGLNEPNWLQDDEAEPATEDELPAAFDEPTDDSSGLNEPNWLQDDEAEPATEDELPAAFDEPTDDSSGLNEPNWLQDDEAEPATEPSWLQDDEAEPATEELPAAFAEPTEDSSGLNEPNWLQDDESEPDTEPSWLQYDEAEPASEPNWLQDDEAEPASEPNWLQDDEAEPATESNWLQDDKAEPASEPNWLQDDEAEPATEPSWLQDDEAEPASESNWLQDDEAEPASESNWLQDDEAEPASESNWSQDEDELTSDGLPETGQTEPATEGLTDSLLDQMLDAIEDEPASDDLLAAFAEQIDDSSDLSEPDWTQDDETGQIEPTTEGLTTTLPGQMLDEVEDDSDWLQDDETEQPKPSPEGLAAAPLGQILDEVEDEDESDWLQNDAAESTADSTLSAEVEEPVVSGDIPTGQQDDLSGLDGIFDDSNSIQDDEAESTNQEPTNNLQDEADSFSNLFADSNFDDADALSADEIKDEPDNNAGLSEMDDFFKPDETNDDVSKRLQQEADSENEQNNQDENFLLPDFDITADTENTDLDDTQQKPAENETAKTNSGTMENTATEKLEPFEFEQEEMKKQLEAAVEKLKKVKMFSYLALIFGVIALMIAIGLGITTYSAQTEVAALTDVVSTLETNLEKSAENNSNKEINAMVNSVVQLNQQFYEFITDLKGNPQLPAGTLNNKVPDIIAKQVIVSNALKSLQGKIPELNETTLSGLSIIEPAKIEPKPVAAKESTPPPMPPVKTEAAIEPIPTAQPESIAPEQPPAKKQPKVEAVTQAKIKAEAIKPKPAAKAPTKQPSKPIAKANWGVNLAAFKQEWFAQSKAAEFARQGIYADIIPIQGNDGTLYRLRVDGFASKKEAEASKNKIKRVLNLDSVWVSDN
ncbi:MAG: SPOR domain-containing protein, partial [Methylobacter sp.]|nr:SPOR domain-containing protein [Methylobacter sp.]